MTYRILSIDGGGIRGLIPAQLLTYLEHDHGKRISDMFDLLVGTSTGGIICLGLTHPRGFSAKDLVNLYLDNASEIFPPSCPIKNLFDPKYDGTGLASVLRREFGSLALSAAARPVCVTAFDLVSQQPVFLRSYAPAYSRCDTFFDAACATSAGETYFPAHGNLIDGGNIANNPSLVGLAEMVRLGHDLSGDTRVLSLGTGRYDPSLANIADGGELAWASNVSQVTIDGVAERDAGIANTLLGGNYLRLQPTLSASQSPMDNIDVTNMAELQALAAQAYDDNQQALTKFFAP